MQIRYEGFDFDLADEWIFEGGLDPLSGTKDHYQYEECSDVFLIQIKDISPLIRAAGIPIFKDGESDGVFVKAQQRTVRLLRGMLENEILPPIEVVDLLTPNKYRYKLTHGCHRLHCAISCGYKRIPAKYGFDIYGGE